ncbi:bile acid 7-alpha dehydratase [Priestia megaterium]|uniref:bile acid 7-alpha dehydratase n=1 Tax=Priestia megaterium TaxID=1404 RepID=UPI003670E3EF
MLLKKANQNSDKQLIEKLNVKELIEFERFCRDNAQWKEMKTCFTADSTIKISWFRGTGEEFVNASSQMKSYAPQKLYNTLVWLNENNDKAVAITMASIQMRTTIDDHPLEVTSDVKLFYRTKKINNVWYVYSMEGIYEKDTLIPVYPNNHISLPVKEISKYRPIYANLSYILAKEGYEIDNELPGIDKPELVNEIYEEAEKWLNQE